VFAWRSFEPSDAGFGPGAFLTIPSLASAGISAVFTTRLGGRSAPPYAALNLSFVSGDDADAVRSNRERATATLGLGPDAWTGGRQVHGVRIAQATSAERGAGAASPSTTLPETDALWTEEPGIAVVVLAADCVPVLIADARRPAVAVVHVGRRGLLAGVIERAVEAMGGGSSLRAFAGPSIGPCCYEVDAGSAAAAAERFGDEVVRGPARRHLDLWRGCALALARASVGQISLAGVCTRCENHRFYSHRAGDRGRQGLIACLT
jgi:purine-nucleoside/S-methyl-5'-thioadenosine phosphorylase / adenosine deaminase